MTKSIVVVGASKGIGRAAAGVLAEQGWSVIGVARSTPHSFPGVFIQTDLADQKETAALAKDWLPVVMFSGLLTMSVCSQTRND